MAGLLDLFNSPEGQQALGLLAAGGPQTDPSKTGFGQRLAAASGFADQWKQRQADAEMEKQKMAINAMLMQKHQMDLDSAKQSFADQAKMRDLVSQYRTPATPAMPGGLSADAAGALPPEMQTGSTVKPMAARPSGFDREGYGAALEGINPEMGLSYLQKSRRTKRLLNCLRVSNCSAGNAAAISLCFLFLPNLNQSRLPCKSTNMHAGRATLEPSTNGTKTADAQAHQPSASTPGKRALTMK